MEKTLIGILGQRSMVFLPFSPVPQLDRIMFIWQNREEKSSRRCHGSKIFGSLFALFQTSPILFNFI